MTTKEQILNLLRENPNYSARVIGEKLNLSRSYINKCIHQLGIYRDREYLRKCNNTQRSFPIDISYNTEQIILGSILGDGYITKNKRFINSKMNLNSALNIKHSLIQKDYCEFKATLLQKEGVRVKISIKERTNIPKAVIKGREINSNGEVILTTRKCISFNKYRDLFYKSKKYINRYIYKLGPLGLAIWFMDDGSKHTSGYYLHTEGFTPKDHNLLIKVLKHNFDIDSTIHKVRNHLCIYIRSNSADRFKEIIEPFICDTMKYKLRGR